jgi:hypothetical protein
MIAADDIEFFMVFSQYFTVFFFGVENYLNPATPASYNLPSLGDENMPPSYNPMTGRGLARNL